MLDTLHNVLVLAPHTDDGELGCGGTIARLVEEGKTVHYVAFSICEESVPDRFPEDILATEVAEATASLGIEGDNLTVYRFAVRTFPGDRQRILDALVELRGRMRPEIVFLPSSDDMHQDHKIVCEEGIRAFKKTTVLGYELPWNNIRFESTALVPLEKRHLASKIEALKFYKSQEHRNYVDESFIESLAEVRGAQAGCSYAEAFEVVRWIIR